MLACVLNKRVETLTFRGFRLVVLSSSLGSPKFLAWPNLKVEILGPF